MNYEKMFRLDGKVSIVTGASGIIGSQVVRGLLEQGSKVAALDINKETCSSLMSELSTFEKSGQLIPVICDVASQDSVQNAISTIVNKWGKIDVLHNNAATKSSNLDAFFASYEEYSLDEWRKIMNVNVDGMFLMSQAVGKQMIKQGTGGSIIQTASIYGVVAPDHRIYEGSFYLNRQISSPAVYSVSKGAVVMLSRYLSTYWANKKIRVNTIVPGGVESGQNDTFKQNYSRRIPLGRMAQSYEMVGTIVFLASDASTYITGQEIFVDGGLTAW